MPMGTHHRIVGTLRWTELGFTLYPDEGGYWVLHFPYRLEQHALRQLDRGIYVSGKRCGFNFLDVGYIYPPPPEPNWHRLLRLAVDRISIFRWKK